MTGQILNIAGYQFTRLSCLPDLQGILTNKCLELALKGTILLSEEGTNQVLAGSVENICAYQQFLADNQLFMGLSFKQSWSSHPPFKRLLVKIKKEIITLGLDHIQPVAEVVPTISPQKLNHWLKTRKDFLLLDTRNRFEFERGSFDGAVDLNIQEFNELPGALTNLPESAKQQQVVIFCTGGVRCEKAGLVMQEQGYQQVYQLEGGILNYIEQYGGEYYHGDCFVFDDRLAVDVKLKPIHE